MSVFTCYFLAGQVIWGFLPIFWKSLALLDPVYLLSMRILFSSLFCGLYLFLRSPEETARRFRDRPLMRRLGAASVFITLNWGLYIMMVNTGHIFEASLAYFINPILCLLFSAFFFKEKLNRWQKAAALTAAAGILLSFLLYGSIPWLSLALCSPFAVYSVIKKKVNVPGMFSVCAESLFMTPPSLIYILWRETSGGGAAGVLTGAEWLLLPMTGLLTAIPMALFSAGLRGISFSAAAILMYTSPAIQIFLALFYGETLSPIMLVNFGFVLSAVFLYIAGSLENAGKLMKKRR